MGLFSHRSPPREPIATGTFNCTCAAERYAEAMRLGDVPSGSEVRVCCLDGAGPIARRLAEMGFVPGTLIEVVRRAPLSDPIEFRLRGYLVSLRREEALLIRVHSTLSDPSAIGQAPAGDASDR